MSKSMILFLISGTLTSAYDAGVFPHPDFL